MPPLARIFEQARERHRAGDLRQAEALCRQVVHLDREHSTAWHLLGLALHGQGRLDEAADCYRAALQLQPALAEAHHDLGRLLAQAGRHAEATPHLRRALALRPDSFDSLTQLGIALAHAGEVPEALALLAQAASGRPDSPQAHHNLGVALAQAGRPAEAVGPLTKALDLHPGYAEARYNLGTVLAALGGKDEAVAAYEEAIRLRPDYGEAYNNLGLTLTELRRPAEAEVILRQAVRLRPAAPEGHNNLALALADLGRFGEARQCYHEALRLDPNYADAHANLGNCYKEEGRTEEALACYRVALWVRPDSPSTRYNRSLALLRAGRYEEGFREYEWRWRRPQTPARPFEQPAWDGEPFGGKAAVLLYCEQGLGDAIQFARYAPLVKRLGGTVVLECPGLLVPLFSRLEGPDRVVAEGEPLPPFDAHAALLSLPRLLGTTLEGVPAEVPYLSADPDLAAHWGERLSRSGAFRVGIVWQGNPSHQWDGWRSVPLARYAALAGVEGVELVSLQRRHGVGQLGALGGRFPVTQLEAEGREWGFQDTAAVLASVDLVVTVDSAVAHLAGAMGRPTWVGVAAVSDWRWLLGREDTPWYPTMRLFRQGRLGDWDGVFRRMRRELRRLVAREAEKVRGETGSPRGGPGPGTGVQA